MTTISTLESTHTLSEWLVTINSILNVVNARSSNGQFSTIATFDANGTISTGNTFFTANGISVANLSVTESNAQASSSVSGEGSIATPWLYTSAIEAYDEREENSCGILFGSSGATSSGETIGTHSVSIFTDGNNQVTVDSTGNTHFNNNVIVSNAVIQGVSDDRLKIKESNLTETLDKIKNLDTFYYRPNETAISLGVTNHRTLGMSAQQLQEVFPELIQPSAFNTESEQYLTIDYAKLSVVLLSAIKEIIQHLEKEKELS